MNEKLAVFPQYIVPQHLLSRMIGLVAESKIPAVKNTFIQRFIKLYGINMDEALESDPTAYECFNDFFTRALEDGARDITQEGIASPADGAVSQIGEISNDLIFQAKGHHYRLDQLLGGSYEKAEPFKNGSFATIYLSPKDYHRVHMPFAGTLTEMTYVPGKLFSVNGMTASQVPSLFARNERVVCHFDTAVGPMVVVLVGAMIVASIETVWAGLVTPPKRKLLVKDYTEQGRQEIVLDRGAEMGRFKLGSTAIVLFPEGKVKWDEQLNEGSPVRMGQNIATII
ncbi:phosphatidylserine decarboxylase [Gammaproteobacteria bacterium 45_16_T64]|nr:phosphatidylserine decarboxylase [Gammaproteobacteria bacterium 45_16_T64]